MDPARYGLDRFQQIEPKMLIACDGVSYGGRDFDRTGVVAELQAALPSVRHVLIPMGVHLLVGLGDDPDRALRPGLSVLAN